MIKEVKTSKQTNIVIDRQTYKLIYEQTHRIVEEINEWMSEKYKVNELNDK